MPDLEQEDFEILDNEKPQPIVLFENSVQPITVVVMLDTSGSMTAAIALLREAAEQFVLRLLPEDKAKVGAFNDKIEVSAQFTSDRDDLISDVKNLDYGNGTRLYDAMGFSLDELKGIEGTTGHARLHRRRRHGEPDATGTVIDRARVEEVMVYSIGLEASTSTASGWFAADRTAG